jgi:hypothetical protein
MRIRLNELTPERREKVYPIATGCRSARSAVRPWIGDLVKRSVHRKPVCNPILFPNPAILIALAFLLFRPASASADDGWIPASGGNWSDAANWTTGVPVAGALVDVYGTDGVSRTVIYDFTGPITPLGGLYLGLTGGGVDSENTLEIDANTLTMGSAASEYIGQSGSGAIVQTGGTNDLSALGTQLYVGGGSQGSYSLSGTGKLNGSYEFVGTANCTGTFTQTAGTNSVSGYLFIAYASGSAGSYSLSDTGSLVCTGPEAVGEGGSGIFYQYGGSNSTSELDLGSGTGGSATYDLNAGATLAVSGNENVGYVSPGTFNQYGGTHTITNSLNIGGSGSGTQGDFNLDGGTLIAASVNVGSSMSSGVLGMGNATLTISGTLYIAATGGSYIFQAGGSLTATSTLDAGSLEVAAGLDRLGGLSGTGTTDVGNASGASASLTVEGLNQGTVTINSTGLLKIDGGSSNSVNSLTIDGSGILDLTNRHLFINYGSTDPIATIRGYLASGYASGAWTGVGIDSSAAAANSHYALGYADSADPGNPAALAPGQIEIKYTLYGDLNLDGVVNGDDFGILAANFGKTVTGGWDVGDLNGDGVVNGDDFGLLAANFGKTASGAAIALPASEWAALDAFAAAHGLLADVPEPASASVLLFSAFVGMSRRRRCVVIATC